MKVALVHDWLTGMRGGEKCLEVLCELFPDAPIYTLLHNKGAMSPLIESKTIVTSFIDSLPKKENKYRYYLPLYPAAIEQFDFSGFDLIVSTSSAVAKGAKAKRGAVHICYCHTPMRYVWEMYDEYFGPGKAGLVTRTAMKLVAPYLRWWDVRTAKRVNHYIANSENVRKRIQLHYKTDATVIFPPVDTEKFTVSTEDAGYSLIVSALVPYKKVDLAINVFNKTGEKLIVVGKGPEAESLKSLAKPNIEFIGWASDSEISDYYRKCKMLIFPGEEDFGIVPLEAMACGKPIIAYGKGGALETVIDKKTGVFFYEQTTDALLGAIRTAENMKFDSYAINNHVQSFSRHIYKQKMREFIDSKIAGKIKT
jgi:glycosyltransferase involved in cell wall biosynthesis